MRLLTKIGLVGALRSIYGIYIASGQLVLKAVSGVTTIINQVATFEVRDSSGNTTFQYASATGRLSISGNTILLGSTTDNGVHTTYKKLINKKTAIADNTATDIITVTVPNANQSAGIRLMLVAANGSTDAFESTRVAEGFIAIARTSGAATVATAATLTLTAIATVSLGATHTLAYGVSAVTGANGASQTFTIQVTIDDSGNLGGNQCLYVAEVINSEDSGVTIASA